jgi:hypothetical protein
VAGTAIEVIKLQITKHNAAVEQYKNEAVVNGEWVKQQTEITKRYLGQVDGLRISSEIQKNQLDAEVGTVLKYNESLVNIHKAEVDAAEVKSKISLAKLEQQKINTEIFLAKLEGDKNKVSLYLAELEGEKGKANIATEMVKADALKLESQKALVTLNIAIEELKLKQNAHILDKYKTDILSSQTETDTELKRAGLKVQATGLDLQKYELDINQSSASADVKLRRVATDLKAAELKLNASIADLVNTTASYLSLQKLIASVSEGAASLNAQIGSAALNAGSVSASISDTAATSSSKSESESKSESRSSNSNSSYSSTYNHNYNQSI